MPISSTPSNSFSVNNNNGQTEIYMKKHWKITTWFEAPPSLLSLFPCPCIARRHTECTRTHTHTDEWLAIHSSLRLNHFWARARTRTHQETPTMFALLLIGIDAILVACVLLYTLSAAWFGTPQSHRCVFFSPKRRITYPTCPLIDVQYFTI